MLSVPDDQGRPLLEDEGDGRDGGSSEDGVTGRVGTLDGQDWTGKRSVSGETYVGKR